MVPQEVALQVLAALGGLGLLKGLLSCLSFFYVTFLRPAKNVKKLGSWAVVTGATDGIGKAVAMELARKGLNIVLVSRTQSKLDEAKAEIKEKASGSEVETVAMDFSKGNKADYDKLASSLKDKEIGVLYNNVGISYDHADGLESLTDEKIDAIIEVNNRAMVKMTKLVLPKMLERKKGAIVNVGSFEGCITAPFYAVYGASKAFVEWFSRDLAVELKGKGVTCHDHIALFVATKMAIPNEKRRKGTMFTPWPKDWAKASVSHIGYDSYIVPYWAHAIQAAVFMMLPNFLKDKVRYDQNLLIKKIAYKKKEKEAKGQ